MAEENKPQGMASVGAVAQGKQSKKPKKRLARKFAQAFSTMSREDAEDYIIDNVIVPSIMNAIADILGDAVDYVFRGRVGGRAGRSGNKGNTYGSTGTTDYGKFSQNPKNVERVPGGMRGIDNVTFESRAAAKDVLDELVTALDRYKKVSVYNFYEAASLQPPNGYMDYNYGWYDLSAAQIVSFRGDWYIQMPRIVELQ